MKDLRSVNPLADPTGDEENPPWGIAWSSEGGINLRFIPTESEVRGCATDHPIFRA